MTHPLWTIHTRVIKQKSDITMIGVQMSTSYNCTHNRNDNDIEYLVYVYYVFLK